MRARRANASIRDATTAADIESARALFEEYAASLDVDLCFQDFASELANLPGDYAPPRGFLLLLRLDAFEAGCVALRPIGPHVAELKRLYLRPEARRGGWGRRLALAAIDRARALGYHEIRLDTLASMVAARNLYATLGFRPCAPYYRNPLPGVVWLALDLVTSAPTADPPSASR